MRSRFQYLSSLRSKLLFFFLLTGVTPLAVVGYMALRNNQELLEKDAGEEMELLASGTIDKIDRNLFERYGDVQAFAFHPAAHGTQEEATAAANFFTRAYGIYDLMMIVDMDGNVFATNTLDWDGKPLSGHSVVGTSVRGQDWFEAIRSGKIRQGASFFSDPTRDPMVRSACGIDALSLNFSAPIFDADGVLVGAWSNRASWDRIVMQIMTELEGDFAEAGFEDIEGLILSSDGTVLYPGSASSESSVNLARAGLLAAQEATHGKSGYTVEMDASAGKDVVNAYQASQGALGFPGYGWSVLVRQHLEDALAGAALLRKELLLDGLVAAILTIVVGSTLAARISGPVREAARVLGKVAEGDFTQQLARSSNDEVGQMAESLNQAVSDIRNALAEVRESAAGLAQSSTQVSATTNELSDGSQRQASALEETAASLQEITGTVKQNADSARQANQLALDSRSVAESGGKVVAEAVEAIREINRSSDKIANIITTIDEIAFQTNLLALNAAVEAARAGEQGRGFAVVAAEVRNLAQRSATSAKEIKALIEESQSKVKIGSDLIDRSGKSLAEIVNSVKRVTDIIAEISAASQEQATGVEEVNRAVTQMDQVVQSTAGQSTELAATARSLAGQAHQLEGLVSRFVLEAGSSGRAAGVRQPAPREEAQEPRSGPELRAPLPARSGSRAKSPAIPRAASVPSGSDDDGFIEF